MLYFEPYRSLLWLWSLNVDDVGVAGTDLFLSDNQLDPSADVSGEV